jgi:predicted permease
VTREGRRPDPLSTEEDVDRELGAHIALHIERLVADGVDPGEARQRARTAFGNRRAISRQCRQIASAPTPRERVAGLVESIIADSRFAWRTLRRSPAFLITAVATLALGIGANAAIFGIVNGILLRPLPYRDADRIVALWERTPAGNDNSIATANFWDWRAQTTLFESMALVPDHRFSGRTTVLGGRAPARLYAGAVTRDFFRTIGVEPLLGRGFAPEEAVEGAPPVIVVSHGVWRDLLGETADLDTATLSVFGTAARVIGVMPPGFTYPGQTQLWFPAELYPQNPSRTSHGWSAIGRLRENATLEAAAAEIDAVGAALRERFGEDTDAVGVNVYPLKQELVGDARRPLLILLGAAGLVLMVACTNLASGLLARGTNRTAEIALRSALGASRTRLVRQMFTEALLLTIMGSAAGVLTAQFVTAALLRSAPGDVWLYATVEVDFAVLAFTASVALATAMLFGLLPALRLTRGSEGSSMRSGARSVTAAPGARVWSLLVAAEVALVVVLLIGSGLLIRSFQAVMDIDAGFESAGVLTIDIEVPSSIYPEYDDVGRFLDAALAELRTIPGVEAAGLVNHLPLSGFGLNGGFEIEGREPEAGYGDYRVAGPQYFEAMGIPLIAGRYFEESDSTAAEPVAIVNEALAREFFGSNEAVGKRIGNLANDSWVYGDAWIRIIGVVGNVRHRALTRPPGREVYVNYRQRPMRARDAVIAVRTSGAPASLIPTVRDRLAALDADVPAELSPMPELVAASVTDRRFTVTVLGAFSAVALLLAAVGIYGVVAYAVARQRRDIGIRLALGAAPGRVRGEVIRAALRPVLMGLIVGIGGALALGRTLATLLFEVEPADPTTFVAVSALLLATAAAACWIPARRSARIDPIVTMRAD